MRTPCHVWQRVSCTLLLLALLAWPAAVRGQGPASGEAPRQAHYQDAAIPLQLSALPQAAPAGAEGAPYPVATWDIEDVVAGFSARVSTLRLDADDRPHLAYTDADSGVLFYAFRGPPWQVEEVTTTQVVDLDMALDSAGRPHIVYSTGTEIFHAWRDAAAAWHGERIVLGEAAPPASQGTLSRIALDLDGADQPHLCYISSVGNRVDYAWRDAGGWHVEYVEASLDPEGGTDLELDAAGNPRVVLVTQSSLMYYVRTGPNNWQALFVDYDTELREASLALDSAGYGHIAYGKASNQLWYAWYDGTMFRTEQVGLYGHTGTTIALDPQGRPRMAYYNSNPCYAWRSSAGLWYVAVIEGMAGAYTSDISVALDDSGLPWIVYQYYLDALRAAHATTVVEPFTAWSRLAFSSYRDYNWEVYAAQGDGTDPARLTWNPDTDTWPNLNHGATQVAFSSYTGDNYELYRMQADGSGLARLTYTPINEYRPVWSPDNSRIVFYGFETASNAEVYSVNADGSGLTRLTYLSAWDGFPTWSPDGQRILFVSDRGGSYQLWTMYPDGSNPMQFTWSLNYPAYPDWSPDGTQIAFNDDYNDDGWSDLAVINVDGTGLTHPLGASPFTMQNLTPSWAPATRQLAYAQVQYVEQGGYWYIQAAALVGLDLTDNSTYWLQNSGFDWRPHWQTTDVLPPASQVAPLPAWSSSSFTVRWVGTDDASGPHSYDVQYRMGPGGAWTDWRLDTVESSGAFAGDPGATYYFRCRARDQAGNLEPYPAGPDAWTAVDGFFPTSRATSPAFSLAPSFVVSWTGDDQGAGIASYDLQVRDGSGPWTDWLFAVAQTAATFDGQPGHTYSFQSRARDAAGNLEDYPGGYGDTQTQVPLYGLAGLVYGSRGQPIALALVESEPAALNAPLSGPHGDFFLYTDDAGPLELAVTRVGFGLQPAMAGILLPAAAAPTFYLPPADDRIAGGNFEPGDLPSWQATGVVTLTAPGHTGSTALQLGGPLPAPVVTPTRPFSASAVLTGAGGLVTASWAALTVPAGAVSGTAVLTLTGVPTVTALPTATQDLGLHLEVALALTDGTPLTATLRPLTLTAAYDDAACQAAQTEEGTLRFWRQDGGAWVPLTGTVDPLSNTVTAWIDAPGRYAVLGEAAAGPWSSAVEQAIPLAPALQGGTLSLLYQVAEADPGADAALLILSDGSAALTYSLPLTATGWVHAWWDLGAFSGATLTVRVQYEQGSREVGAGLRIDEVSVGAALVGAYAVYLPILHR